MSENGPIPTNHVCVYPKSVNDANEIIQPTRHIIHTIRRQAREGRTDIGVCLWDCDATPLNIRSQLIIIF